MRTYATPICSRQRRVVAAAYRHAAGFTLLEVLLVVTIVGILASVVVLSATDVGRQRTIRAEAERLTLAVELARDEARLRNELWGLLVDGASYRFQKYDETRDEWHDVERREFNADASESGIAFLVGSPLRDSNAGVSEYLRTGQGGRDEDHRSAGGSLVDGQRPPDVVIYPGGELTPFDITVTGGDAYTAWVARSDGIQRTGTVAESEVDQADDELAQWLLDVGLVQ